MWTAATILKGLLSFMLEESTATGVVITSEQEKRQLSLQSLSFGLKDKVITTLFPEITKAIKKKLAQRKQELAEKNPSDQ